ncbi:MAG: hypothetical protein ACI9YL_000240 [Luteibaculaceae bacterium]|jgi:hypothetical protein
MRYPSILYILCIGLVLFSCKKEKKDDPGTDDPVIEIVDIYPTSLSQFKDSLTIEIAFIDRNGDIGTLKPDDPSLEIRDTRILDPELYHIPPITPDQQELFTKGTFKIVLPSIFLFGNGGAEFTTFSIRVKDREAHWSERVVTQRIVITK